MRKTSMLVFLAIFTFMWLLNSYVPMIYGDDYIYSLVWSGSEAPFIHPIDANAKPISSFGDIVASMQNHYEVWGGRIPPHALDQFFLWIGKPLFNVCNALAFTLLIAEIYILSERGCFDRFSSPLRIVGIFLTVWMFTLGFGATVMWQTGALNYLWTTVFVLGFLIPYVQYWFTGHSVTEDMSAIMVLFGFFAGWTNEHTIPWVIVACAYVLYERGKAKWAIAGLIGMALGYSMLFIAPGNFVRASVEALDETPNVLLEITQILLLRLYLLLTTGFIFARSILSERETKFSLGMVFLYFAPLLSMLMANIVPLRTEFFSFTCLTSLLFFLLAKGTVRFPSRKFCFKLASVFFIVTATATLYFYHELFESSAKAEAMRNEGVPPVEIARYLSEVTRQVDENDMLYYLSGFRTVKAEQNQWADAAVEAYFKR